MISLNAFSLFDLLAALVTANIAAVFLYRLFRRKRLATDVSFTLTTVAALAMSLLIFAADNVVEAGTPATSVPHASEHTTFYYRLIYAVGVFYNASLTHFTLRFCRIPRLVGWKVAYLYIAAAAASTMVWSEHFFRPALAPVAATSSWTCAVPFPPQAGLLMVGYFLPVCCTAVFYLYFLWWRPRPPEESKLTEVRKNVVRLGVTVMGLSWIPELVLATLYSYAGVDISLIVLTFGMIAVAVCLAEENIQSEREREHVTRRFRSYVDPALVKYVLDHPLSERIESEVRELTVVFTDLEGFTAISENLREGVVKLVNEYLRLMTPLISKHNGYRDKFLGDGMTFFYGAPEKNPDHAIHAVATVLKMQETMVELNRYVAGERHGVFAGLPTLVMRAGVSTGHMVVGDAGTNEASDYTVLGDTVNLGARLETANKATGTRILLSERTAALIPADLFLLRPIARLRVIGRQRPVMAYEPLAYTKDATSAQIRRAELTQVMVNHFIQADFVACREAERQLEREDGPSKLGKIYRDLCASYAERPPGPDFAGEIVLTEK